MRALVSLSFLCSLACAQEKPIVVASKTFTESVVLAELATQSLRHEGVPVEHRKELGGSRVLFEALRRGDIDVYAEYTGTLTEELFGGDRALFDPEVRATRLAEMGLGATATLGFDNSYALGMRRKHAARLGITTTSQLRAHPGFRFGFSSEFLERGDGWRSLQQTYSLPQKDVRGLEHDLAYRGLANGDLDVIDLYTTDAEIRYYDLVAIRDDLDHFPEYRALFLYRLDTRRRLPRLHTALARFEGAIPEPEMIAMNERAKLERIPAARVAADWLEQQFGFEDLSIVESRPALLWRSTLEHLGMVLVALFAAIFVAIPLGVWAHHRPRAGHWILSVVAILQTVPALALLVLMIPLLGIGLGSAVFALFVYSLLPIVRNTHAGLEGIPVGLRESADALGLAPRTKLLRIELPLALPSVLAGIKTSAVICVGTATLGALIGAGGYGQPILTGIRLDDHGLILLGAIPAAILALLVQALFAAAERRLVSPGLRA